MWNKMSSSSSSNSSSSGHEFLDVDTKTLPTIGAEIWKFSIDAWFQRGGVDADKDKFNYIIAAAEDDIVRVLGEKKVQLKRPLQWTNVWT